jgi:hypothetical protein
MDQRRATPQGEPQRGHGQHRSDPERGQDEDDNAAARRMSLGLVMFMLESSLVELHFYFTYSARFSRCFVGVTWA